VSYLAQLDLMLNPAVANPDYYFLPKELRPEARWMVDPDDYLKPLVYDPKDQRWSKPAGRAAVGACN